MPNFYSCQLPHHFHSLVIFSNQTSLENPPVHSMILMHDIYRCPLRGFPRPHSADIGSGEAWGPKNPPWIGTLDFTRQVYEQMGLGPAKKIEKNQA